MNYAVTCLTIVLNADSDDTALSFELQTVECLQQFGQRTFAVIAYVEVRPSVLQFAADLAELRFFVFLIVGLNDAFDPPLHRSF